MYKVSVMVDSDIQMLSNNQISEPNGKRRT